MWTTDKAATCTEEGSKSHHCSRCSAITDVTVIEKKAHSYSSWVTDKTATCAEEGLRHKTCSACGDVFSQIIEKRTHRYTPWIVDKEVTCTENGNQYKYCTNCGYTVSETLDAYGHEYMWFIDVEATCISEGSKTYRCKYCTNVKAKEIIPVSENHFSSSWITDTEATVYKSGSKHKECTECCEILETVKIPQLKCSKPALKSIKNSKYGVLIKWCKVKGADKYRVYRKTSKSDWEYIGYTSNTYYTDKTAKSGTKYHYAIKARNEAGNSGLSNSLSKYYLADLSLTNAKSTSNGVKLEWSKVKGAQGYYVYKKNSSGEWIKIATIKNTSKTSYTDAKVQKGKKYTYKVKAFYSKTGSAYSNTKTVKHKY